MKMQNISTRVANVTLKHIDCTVLHICDILHGWIEVLLHSTFAIRSIYHVRGILSGLATVPLTSRLV